MIHLIRTAKVAVFGLGLSASAAFATAPEAMVAAVSSACCAIGICCGMGCC